MSNLLNEDILCTIYEHFDQSWDGINVSGKQEAENQEALARSARVCKAFYEPSVRVLWRRLEALFPLLCLIPTFTQIRACEYEYIYVSVNE